MALANTLTGLIPTLYAARDIVARELTGFIPSVTIDAESSRAALNQTVRVEVTPALSSTNITPAMTPPTPNGVTIGYTDMTITKAKAVQIPWNGEEQKSIDENGPGIDNVMRDLMAQALRTLTNEIEADLAGLYIYASRAYGTAGVTPFASTLGDPAQVRKILDDNGCPPGDRQLVISTAAGAALRTLAQLTKANEAGTDETLRRGELLNIHGFSIRESAQIANNVAGSGTGYVVNNASGYAAGTTTLASDLGSGTILAGNILTVTQSGRDANKYVVGSALNAGSLGLNKPGTRVALVDEDTLAILAGYSANMAFHRSALVLLARAPYLPGGRDMAIDRTMITDPNTGLPFEVAYYPGYHQNFLEVSMAWGVAAIKSENIALLLG